MCRAWVARLERCRRAKERNKQRAVTRIQSVHRGSQARRKVVKLADKLLALAGKIGDLEEMRQREESSLEDMARAEARREAAAKKLIERFEARAQAWQQEREKLATEEQVQTLEVERLAGWVEEADHATQRKDNRNKSRNASARALGARSPRRQT